MYKEIIEEMLDLYRHNGNRIITVLKLSAVTMRTAIISLIIARVFSEEEPLKKVLLLLTAFAGAEHVFIAMQSHKFNKQYIKAEDDRDEALRTSRISFVRQHNERIRGV